MSDPFLKFYTSDWRADPRLKMCSPAARGMWIEMICLMHEATPYGHLLVHGQNPTEAQLASLTGIQIAELGGLIAELERNGVFSRTREGVIYSRKLVRMEQKAAIARRNGKKGGSLPVGKRSENNGWDNPSLKSDDKPQKPYSRSQKEEDANASLSELRIAVDAFNATAAEAGWPQCQRLSKAREAALKAILAECGGIDGWRIALAKARASPHLTGQNDRGWTASFDFLTQASSFAKLMEGNYDPRPRNIQRTPQGAQRSDAALEQIARLAGLGQAPGDGRGGTGGSGEEAGPLWVGARPQ